MTDHDFSPAELRDGETRDDAHARRNEEFIRQAKRELEAMDDETESPADGRLTQCRACDEWCEGDFCSDDCREYWNRRDARL